MSERVLPMALLLALGIVGYKEFSAGNFPPRPYTLLGVAFIFTVLGVLSAFTLPLAAALGVAADLYLLFGTGTGKEGGVTGGALTVGPLASIQPQGAALNQIATTPYSGTDPARQGSR